MSNKDVRDEYDRIWDDRGTRAYGKFTLNPFAYGTLVSVIAVVVCVALLAGIVFGLQSLVFATQNRSQAHQVTLLKIQNRQIHASNSYQETMLSDISDKLGQVETTTAEIQGMAASDRPSWEAQRYQVTQEICADAANLTSKSELPPSGQKFVAVHCIGGAANPAARNNY